MQGGGGHLFPASTSLLTAVHDVCCPQDWLVRAMERARKAHLEGYDPYVVAARLTELEEEMEAQRLQLSPVYR